MFGKGGVWGPRSKLEFSDLFLQFDDLSFEC